MAKETPPSLTPVDLDPEAIKGEKERWIGAVDAAAVLGMAFTTWRRKEQEGNFQRYKLNGRIVYDRQEMEAFASLNEPSGEMGAVVTVLLAHQKEQNKHTIELVKASTDAQKTNAEVVKANSDTLRLENDALRTRIGALEEKYLGAVDKWEQAQQHLHERELERLKAEKSEKRKDRAFETMMALGPVLSEQILGTHTIGKLLKSLTEEQIIALTDDTISFFSAEQKEKLKFALAKFREGEKKKEALPKGGAEEKAKDIIDKVTSGSEKAEGLKHKPKFAADVVDRVAGPSTKTNGAASPASSPEKAGNDNVRPEPEA
jgi:hypothetical protein